MEIDDIRKLVELMEERGVVELEMEDRKGKVRLVRENHRTPVAAQFAPPPVSLPAQPVLVATPVASERTAEPSPTTDMPIVSPMVGTFYRAPSPDSKPYVDVGSVVEQEDVVCIIEAMKMMNEIRAEVRGRVRKILVESGQPIEYGQPLFLLEPL